MADHPARLSHARLHPLRPLAAARAALWERIAQRADASERSEDLGPEIAELDAAGLLTAPLPLHKGGEGLGTTAEGALPAFEVLRALGRSNLSLARLYEGHVNALRLIALYGAAETRAAVQEAVRGGALLGVWGADDGERVRIRRTDRGFRLTGAKRFASGLGLVSLAVVTALPQDEERPQLVLVPADDATRADPAAWTASGMRATQSGRYELDGVIVGPDALLGAPGDYLREPHFEGGTWRYCAAHLGGAEALLAAMVARLTDRDRAEDPHQEVRIAAAARACETARLWVKQAAERVESGAGDPQQAAAYALLARETTQECCLTVIRAVDDALGTAACDTRDPVERMRRDLGLFIRQAAPDAKRSRAVRTLIAVGSRPQELL